MGEDVRKDVEAVFKSDMETSDRMNELVEDHNAEEINDAALSAVEDLIERIDSPRRMTTLFATCYQIGKSTQNEEMVEFAKKHLNNMEAQ